MFEGRFCVSGLEKSREASQKCIDLEHPRSIKMDLTTKKGIIMDGLIYNHKERKEVLVIIQLSQVN